MAFSKITSDSFVVEFKSDSMTSAKHFRAKTQGGNSQCTAENNIDPIGCVIGDLKPAARYLVMAKACADAEFTTECSDEVTATQWTVPLRTFPKQFNFQFQYVIISVVTNLLGIVQ